MTDRAVADISILAALNRHFMRALLLLGEAGEPQRDRACRLAAAAWAELRHTHPREAERLNGVLHALTQSIHPTTHGADHVNTESEIQTRSDDP